MEKIKWGNEQILQIIYCAAWKNKTKWYSTGKYR